MFTHPKPKRVAIIGGGEGATLREVLKHETVETVVMIEIDEMMVETSRELLPGWSDCSNLLSRADDCFDDKRVELYWEDAFQWMKSRFLKEGDNSKEAFDVIIMDALDPQAMMEIVGALYTDEDFYKSLYQGLTKDGILVSQVGAAAGLSDPPQQYSLDRNVASFQQGLEKIGFERLKDYSENGCGFLEPWDFQVALKRKHSETYWYDSEAVVDLKIRNRLTSSTGGETPLKFFDGATMSSYKYPSKQTLTLFFRDGGPEDCPNEDNVARSPAAEDGITVTPACSPEDLVKSTPRSARALQQGNGFGKAGADLDLLQSHMRRAMVEKPIVSSGVHNMFVDRLNAYTL